MAPAVLHAFVPVQYPLVVPVHEVLLGHGVPHLFQCLPVTFVLNLDASKQVLELEEVEEVLLGQGGAERRVSDCLDSLLGHELLHGLSGVAAAVGHVQCPATVVGLFSLKPFKMLVRTSTK